MSNNAGKLKISVDTGNFADGDSIASYLVDSAGNGLTSTLIGADQALDVNVVQSVLPTGAATETTLASLLTELQSITFAEDSVHSSGDAGIMGLAVRNDAGTALAADGDYIPLTTDSTGALRVNATVNAAGDYAEDSAHTSGDIGLFQLGVRNDNQATTFTSANGDYSGYATDSKGAMYTKNVHAASNLQQVVTVGTTATALPASPLANRTEMFIQHLTGGQLYLGSGTVTNSGATRGLQLGSGGYVSLSVGPANLVYGVGSSANREVVVWEFA